MEVGIEFVDTLGKLLTYFLVVYRFHIA